LQAFCKIAQFATYGVACYGVSGLRHGARIVAHYYEERLFSEIRNLPDDGSKQQEGQEKCEHSPQPKEHSVDCDRPRMAGPVQQQGVAHTYRHAHEYVRGRRFKYYALVFHPWSSENRAVYTNIS